MARLSDNSTIYELIEPKEIKYIPTKLSIKEKLNAHKKLLYLAKTEKDIKKAEANYIFYYRLNEKVEAERKCKRQKVNRESLDIVN